MVGDKIVVVGGQADGKLVPQTEVFDGERWTDVAEMPTPREHLGAASDGRYLYAVGGRELSADKNSTAIERYDPADDSWTELDGMPQAAGGVSAAYAGGRVVAIGGEGTTAASDAVQAYDIRNDDWSRLPALPRARHGVAAAAVGDAVYAIGGATSAGHLGSTKEAEVLDLSGKPATAQGSPNLAWRALAGAPSRRRVRRLDGGGRQTVAVRRDRRRRPRKHRNGRLRPGDQHLDARTRAAPAAAPCRGGDVARRRSGDRRLRAGRRADLWSNPTAST